MDLLYEAARSWRELCHYTYHITYGKQKVLHRVSLRFEAGEFYHLAGFQYLSDVVLPFRFSISNTLNAVLDEKVRECHLMKSGNYAQIRDRLTAIVCLKEALETSFHIYLFDAKKLPFYTRLTAQHLIAAESEGIVFLFTDADASGTSYSKSIFPMQEGRDYRKNQKALAILRVERENGERVCLYAKKELL